MFRITESLAGEVFDGEGFKLRKIVQFSLWLIFGSVVLIIKFVTILSVINTVKNTGRNWEN